MVLNGIGGSTIAEAKERLSWTEAQLWMVYRNKHGSLNAIQRNDYIVSMLASLYANSNRRKGAPPFSPFDFTPFQKAPEGPPISLEEAKRQW